MGSSRPMCVKLSVRRLDNQPHREAFPIRAQSSEDRPAAIQTITIFCRIVDFFGDAGFCWRLAVALKQLGVRCCPGMLRKINGSGMVCPQSIEPIW
ncbi:MAG: DUF2331 family protein [Betaproteobacteria bacterium]|nr:DUF2331 family protein [Betaproteobacteria bacterium]